MSNLFFIDHYRLARNKNPLLWLTEVPLIQQGYLVAYESAIQMPTLDLVVASEAEFPRVSPEFYVIPLQNAVEEVRFRQINRVLLIDGDDLTLCNHSNQTLTPAIMLRTNLPELENAVGQAAKDRIEHVYMLANELYAASCIVPR